MQMRVDPLEPVENLLDKGKADELSPQQQEKNLMSEEFTDGLVILNY